MTDADATPAVAGEPDGPEEPAGVGSAPADERMACPGCGYDLRVAIEQRRTSCPECGGVFQLAVYDVRRRRDHRWLVLLAAMPALSVVAFLGWYAIYNWIVWGIPSSWDEVPLTLGGSGVAAIMVVFVAYRGSWVREARWAAVGLAGVTGLITAAAWTWWAHWY